MLIWLASYPRSGNHLARMILKQSFGLDTYTIYKDNKNSRQRAIQDLMGEQSFDEPLPDFLERARTSTELFIVKTHEFVPDSDRAIYLVRDARAVLYSYQRFIHDISGIDRTLPELIKGKHWPGDWSKHVKKWSRRPAHNTLILKYEDLTSSRHDAMAKMGDFIGRSPTSDFNISFDYLRELDPARFGVGNNDAGIRAIEQNHPRLFWWRHGSVMRKFGYQR